MGDGICISYDPQQKPWLVAFDKFDAQGNQKTNRAIDAADLADWASRSLPEAMQRNSDVPLGAICAMFKFDMTARQRFLWNFVRPELQRTSPLNDEDRRGKISSARTMADDKLASAELEGFKSKCKAASSTSGCRGFINMFASYVSGNVSRALSDLNESMSHDRSTLAGCGIGFKKQIGEPVKIISILPDLKEKGFEPSLLGKEIIAIDGRDTRPMVDKEVWAALRGPINTVAVLTVRSRNGSAEEVRIMRRVFLPKLSLYGHS